MLTFQLVKVVIPMRNIQPIETRPRGPAPGGLILTGASAVTKLRPRHPVSQIRPAHQHDLAALLGLEARCFSGDRLSPRSMRRLLAEYPDQILVAERQHEAAAALFLLLSRSHGVARIYSLAVEPTARRLGLGRALLRAAAIQAGRLGKHCLRLEVREDNAAAIALYMTEGFRLIGRREAYYHDGAAALRLQRSLPAMLLTGRE